MCANVWTFFSPWISAVFFLKEEKTPLLQSSWLSLPPTNVLLEEQFSNEKLRVLF